MKYLKITNSALVKNNPINLKGKIYLHKSIPHHKKISDLGVYDWVSFQRIIGNI